MIKNPLTCLDRYDPSWALAPVWEGDTLYNESVLLVEDADGRAQAPCSTRRRRSCPCGTIP